MTPKLARLERRARFLWRRQSILQDGVLGRLGPSTRASILNNILTRTSFHTRNADAVLIFAQAVWTAGLRSREESEVFGWSRIPNNTRSRSRIFCPTPEVQLDHLLHHTPKLGIPVEMVQFLLTLLLKQRFLAVHHDFHWLLIATKLLTAKLHSLYVKESELLAKLGRSRKFWKGLSRIFHLRLRNPVGLAYKWW